MYATSSKSVCPILEFSIQCLRKLITAQFFHVSLLISHFQIKKNLPRLRMLSRRKGEM